MAKRSNNSLGRRSYGGKPYDANNSFVKKMATKVTDFIPQRSWISKWFNLSEDNGEANDDENPEEGDTEEEIQPPASKRPRIRMDVTHPPGTFAIRNRDRQSVNDNRSRKDPFSHINETGEDFLEPPVAGPSGVRRFVSSTPAVATDVRASNVQRSDLNSLIRSRSNGADDNSESSESTSGCSSLIPQTNRQEAPTNSGYNSNLVSRKRMIDEKLTFANHLQSPRSLFLESGIDSLRSRRPSFNASMMSGTLDRTASLSSPFYTGNVTFGGSNALTSYGNKRSLFNATNDFQLKVPRRTSVQVKPSNSDIVDSTGMSQTAKRILEAMEYFSSPISDAKKIPVKSVSSPAGGKKRTRDEISSGATSRVGLRHLTRELSVPTVPEMLKLRRRQKLQDTTLAARKIVSATSGPPASTTAPATQRSNVVELDEYRLRTDQNDNSKYHGKLRTKLKKINNEEEDAPPPMVNLPRISLPITSLPSFEPLPKFTKPPTSTSSSSSSAINHESESFKFASPIKMREAAWNLKSINNFSFSKPLSADDSKDPDESRESNKSSETVSVDSNSSIFEGAATNFMFSSSSTAPRLKLKTKAKERDTSFGGKEPVELKSGSVMDILGGKTSAVMDSPQRINSFAKSSPEIWECVDCYIKNDATESTCVACKASKPGDKVVSNSPQSPIIVAQPLKEGFGSQFKMSSNQWECQSCLVRNQQTAVACVSCSTPKAGEKKAVKTVSSSLMEKFKPVEGSWECPGCMLRNPGNVITCPCCKAAKPSSLKISPNKSTAKKEEKPAEKASQGSQLLAKFKPASNTWECESCLVRNDENTSSCVCCGGSKPGAAKKIPKEAEKISVASDWGDKFKKPQGCWSCDTCMVQNKQESQECVACGEAKPGAPAKPAQFSFGGNSKSFSFGIDKADEKTLKEVTKASTNGFSFGAKPPSTENAGKFSFGMPKEIKIVDKATDNTPKVSGFVFAPPKNAGSESGFDFAKKNGPETAKSDEKKPTFSFGMPKSPEKENSSVFGGQAANGKPHLMSDVESKSSPKVVFGGGSAENIEAKTSTTVTPETSKDCQVLGTKTISEAKTTTNFEAPAENRLSFGFPEVKSKPVTETSSVFSQNSSTPSSFTIAAGKTNEIAAPSSAFGVPSVTPAPAAAEKTPEVKSPPTATMFGGVEKKASFFAMPDAKSTFGTDKKTTFAAGDNKITFGGSEKPAIFNSPATAFPAPTQTLFAAAPSTNNNTPAPVFGGAPVPSFGTSTESSAGIFAAAKPANSDNMKLFTFGAAAPPPAQTPQTTPVFSFTGNSTNTNTPSKSLFDFGASTGTSQTPELFAANPTNSTFGTPAAAPNPTPFTFNAPVKQETPSFGQTPANPIPPSMFGAQPTTPSLNQTTQNTSTGFNFGAAPQTPAPGVFSFGGGMSQPANAPSSGFNFNAPSPSPAIAFDPNTRPSFNFTGGSAPVFNATPQPATTRKIKKAVRRMPQR